MVNKTCTEKEIAECEKDKVSIYNILNKLLSSGVKYLKSKNTLKHYLSSFLEYLYFTISILDYFYFTIFFKKIL